MMGAKDQSFGTDRSIHYHRFGIHVMHKAFDTCRKSTPPLFRRCVDIFTGCDHTDAEEKQSHPLLVNIYLGLSDSLYLAICLLYAQSACNSATSQIDRTHFCTRYLT